MEVRCGKCNKLFRVSNDKITGKGIKFACSRCGDTVKISMEEFETYSLSKAAVSALDMFEPKPKPAETSTVPGVETTVAAEEVLPTNVVTAGTPGVEERFDSSSSEIPDFLREKEETPPAEPNFFEESSDQEKEQPVPEQQPDLDSALAFPLEKPESASSAEPVEMTEEPEQKEAVEAAPQAPPLLVQPQELHTEPERVPEPAPAPKPVTEPEPKRELKPETAAAVKPPTIAPKPATHPHPEQRPPAAAVASPVTKREPARPAAAKRVESAVVSAEPSRSNKMVLVILAVLVLLGAGGYGVYKYVLSSSQKTVVGTTSIDGLRIVNPSGKMEANGDLLITGTVENVTDKERSGWYVVVDVYDAQGTVLNKMRLLNGKQIYTKKDYDILAQRGANVQEQKAKVLQEQGVVIPAKGSVPFEMRYLQPPSGIASFNAVLQPFDPARLYKEIEGEAK